MSFLFLKSTSQKNPSKKNLTDLRYNLNEETSVEQLILAHKAFNILLCCDRYTFSLKITKKNLTGATHDFFGTVNAAPEFYL